MTKTLNVWWDGTLVGTLGQTRGGALEFAYAASWVDDDQAPSLSLSLPKRELDFRERECRPFFAGLLPEEAQRRHAAAALGVSEANDFALLDELGADVAGAIELLPADAPALPKAYTPQTNALTNDELLAVLDKLPLRPLLAGEDGLRLSLAGAQSKLPVVLVSNKVALPQPGQPTTHILKPPIPAYAGTTENEALVMKLAQAVGLDVAEVEPRIVADRPFLLITRYDRTQEADGRVKRLHQEDFCQALGVLPHRKYAKEGGPTFKPCFDLVRRASSLPGKDILAFIDAALFNLFVGNADAHGKNFSLLYRASRTRLAPLYDLLSTVHYPALSPNLAMKIGRAGRLDELDDAQWQRFSADSGVRLPHIRRRGGEICDAIVEQLPRVKDGLSSSGLSEEHLDLVIDTISERVSLAQARLPVVAARPSSRRDYLRG